MRSDNDGPVFEKDVKRDTHDGQDPNCLRNWGKQNPCSCRFYQENPPELLTHGV